MKQKVFSSSRYTMPSSSESNNDHELIKNNSDENISLSDIKMCQYNSTISKKNKTIKLNNNKQTSKICHNNCELKNYEKCQVLSNNDENNKIYNHQFIKESDNFSVYKNHDYLKLKNNQQLSRRKNLKTQYRDKFNNIFNLNKKLTSFWQLCLILFVSFLCTPTAANTEPNHCSVNMDTVGRTWPSGDIILEYGQDLRILCILNQTTINRKYPGKNSSDLYFVHNENEMDPSFIKIINETTIEMFVAKPPAARDMYYCLIRVEDFDPDIEHEIVCLNTVAIGYKPQPPTKFSCISYNWEVLNCTWEPALNYVDTKHRLYYKFPGRTGSRTANWCFGHNPNPSDEELEELKDKIIPLNSCRWDGYTSPIYRLPYAVYRFYMHEENVFGNITSVYTFDHYANVIPAKPENLTVASKTSDGASLYWNIPFPLQQFPVPLDYRISYQHQWNSHKNWSEIIIKGTKQERFHWYNLTDLKYANTVFDVRVYIKSSAAPPGNEKWSNFATTTFRTLPRLPGRSATTNIGSFEIIENNQSVRDVILYWQTIPLVMENGDNFKYQVSGVEENGRKISLTPNEITRTYATFKGISYNTYHFEINTTNIVGANPVKAYITIPAKSETPRGPYSFTKIAFDKGIYELSWKLPEKTNNIKNFTIFWCENDRDRPFQCTGYLDWVHVPNTTLIYNMTVPNPNNTYQFAISSNTEKVSSGMIWASCTVIGNKIVGKLKSLWIEKIRSDYIEVRWNLECSDRASMIEGFRIYYCPISSPFTSECKEPSKNITIHGDSHTMRGIVGNLKPYTTYQITVSMLTKSGEGATSDPLRNTTLEGAPERPYNVTIDNVTSSTMSVRWNKPNETNGVLHSYTVYFNGNHVKVDDAATHYVLKNLLSYKNYSISVTACTVSCSEKSDPVFAQTLIGEPGKIVHQPIVRFINATQIIVTWSRPTYPGGKLDYYQVSKNDEYLYNSTINESKLTIKNCEDEGGSVINKFKVRAMNIDENDNHLIGPWSDTFEANCYGNSQSQRITNILWIIGALGFIVSVVCLLYGAKWCWYKYQKMQDVQVQLPPGLQREKLLQKNNEQHTRQPSADSSVCISGHESVTSSLTSDSHISTDSGTEHDPIITASKSINQQYDTNLRQRIVGNTKPIDGATSVGTSTKWDSYVKLPKTSDIINDDTLSLARSTPNLTDSSGFMALDQTRSSAGYISMPSSEDLSSNNSSPLPKEKIDQQNSYCVVGLLPKSLRKNTIDFINPEVKDNTLSDETKKNIPYVTLASLENKLDIDKKNDNAKSLNDLTFIKSSSMKNIVDKHGSINDLEQQSTTIKPYVTAGMINKPTFATSVDNKIREPTTQFMSNLTDFCGDKSFIAPSSFTNTRAADNKPYVTINTIPDIVTKPSSSSSSSSVLDDHKPFKKPETPAFTESKNINKPYVLASKIYPTIPANSDALSSSVDDNLQKKLNVNYWESEDHCDSPEDDEPKKMVNKTSSGYVTVSDIPKIQEKEKKKNTKTTTSPYVQHQQLDK